MYTTDHFYFIDASRPLYARYHPGRWIWHGVVVALVVVLSGLLTVETAGNAVAEQLWLGLLTIWVTAALVWWIVVLFFASLAPGWIRAGSAEDTERFSVSSRIGWVLPVVVSAFLVAVVGLLFYGLSEDGSTRDRILVGLVMVCLGLPMVLHLGGTKVEMAHGQLRKNTGLFLRRRVRLSDITEVDYDSFRSAETIRVRSRGRLPIYIHNFELPGVRVTSLAGRINAARAGEPGWEGVAAELV